MSKKSRRRNKRLLMMAALAGGAAMMGRGKGKGVGTTETISDAQKAHNFAVAPKTNYINKKVVGPVDDSWLDTPRGPHGAGGKGDYWRRQKDQQYETGEHYTPNLDPYTPRVHKRFNRATGGRIGAKKGGSVTGIAKRGFGRALMKGKK
jgi:hypothetical protein